MEYVILYSKEFLSTDGKDYILLPDNRLIEILIQSECREKNTVTEPEAEFEEPAQETVEVEQRYSWPSGSTQLETTTNPNQAVLVDSSGVLTGGSTDEAVNFGRHEYSTQG